MNYLGTEDGPSSTPDGNPFKHSLSLEQEWVLFSVLTTILYKHSSSQFHKFYHLNTQFLPSSKQTALSTNYRGIFKVVKMSPPSDNVIFFQNTKLEEMSKEHWYLGAGQVEPLLAPPSEFWHPLNQQPMNLRITGNPSKRHSRRKCKNKDDLSQCILRLVKGKYLCAREDVGQHQLTWISSTDSWIQDVKTVYNNLQLCKEKSKLGVRPFTPPLLSIHCLTPALGRSG